jgi:lipopolysaccharide export system permease protein
MLNLLLPEFLTVILPIALFIATLVVYNRLVTDREILASRASGLSNRQLAWPALMWAMMMTLMLYVISLYILPVSFRHFKDLEFDLKRTGATFILQEGEFTTASNLTAYVRSRNRQGELKGVMLQDTRDVTKPMLIVAERGSIYRNAQGTYLILTNGSHQQKDANGRLSVLYFDEFLYDLGSPQDTRVRERKPHEQFITDLFNPPKNSTNPQYANQLYSEAHQRLLRPLLALVFAMLAVWFILNGEFRRHGRQRQILKVVALVIFIQGGMLWLGHMIVRSLWLTPLLYIIVLGPLIIAWSSLDLGKRSKRILSCLS